MLLVLAIEPDLRQAAILKRIVRDRVKAALIVVDSRDAAMEAIRKQVPDVLLLSALLSPRDEDELIQYLRGLDGADHTQTHTIPQLASTLADRETPEAGRGLFGLFKRKKEAEPVVAGCDPDLFADEIRTFLEHAARKREELRLLAESGVVLPDPGAGRPATAARTVDEPAEQVTTGSSWSSPFEWKPAQPSSPAPTPELRLPDRESPIAASDDSEPAFAEPAGAAEAVEHHGREEPLVVADAIATDASGPFAEAPAYTEPAGHAEPQHDEPISRPVVQGEVPQHELAADAPTYSEAQRGEPTVELVEQTLASVLEPVADALVDVDARPYEAAVDAHAGAIHDEPVRQPSASSPGPAEPRSAAPASDDPWATDYRRLPMAPISADHHDVEIAAPAPRDESEPLVVEHSFRHDSRHEPIALEPIAAAAVPSATDMPAATDAEPERHLEQILADPAFADAGEVIEDSGAAHVVSALDSGSGFDDSGFDSRSRIDDSGLDFGSGIEDSGLDSGWGIEDSGSGIQDEGLTIRDSRSLGPLASWVRFEAARREPETRTTSDELRELMAHFALPPQIAGVSYARGCRIRRVRVPGGRERRKGAVPGPVILSRKALDKQRRDANA